jgi:hypothetical protein
VKLPYCHFHSLVLRRLVKTRSRMVNEEETREMIAGDVEELPVRKVITKSRNRQRKSCRRKRKKQKIEGNYAMDNSCSSLYVS